MAEIVCVGLLGAPGDALCAVHNFNNADEMGILGGKYYV